MADAPCKRSASIPARRMLCREVMDQRRRDALRRAAERVGGRSRLAGFLGVDAEQVERWLAGTETAPAWAYSYAFDLIADEASFSR
jgi:hypothetical protein